MLYFENSCLCFSKWDFYANLAGTELPVTSVETLATKLSAAKINISVVSVNDDERWYPLRWEYAMETIKK